MLHQAVLDVPPPNVAGMDRFLQLRTRAKQQQQERQEREARVFCLSPKQHETVTVPQPFQLGSQVLAAKAAQRREAVRRELLQAVSEQCTFTPVLVARR